MVKQILSKFLSFYQKYLSLLGFGSCRYYPTCSEYAKWQIETNPNLFSALFASFMRILRCNQFFVGGIDYPKISSLHFNGQSSPYTPLSSIRYWFVPHKGRYKVIKNIFSKGSMC